MEQMSASHMVNRWSHMAKRSNCLSLNTFTLITDMMTHGVMEDHHWYNGGG